MTDNNKDPKGNIITNIAGGLKKGFDAAGKAADANLNKGGEAVKGALDFGAKVVAGAGNAAGNVVGKERVEGAIVYGTIGAGVGSLVPGKGTLIGGAAGAAIGFVGGKPLLDFYKKVNGQDTEPPADKSTEPKPETAKEETPPKAGAEKPVVPDVKPPSPGDRL